MKLSSIKDLKNLLKEHNLSPRKGLGQNFLIDKNVLQKIIQTAELRPEDVVLEIGPGLGFLTTELAKRAKKVVAVEKDEKIAEILINALKKQNINNVEVIVGDILKIENIKLKIENYKVVANLPYYITAPVIRKFLENKQKPESMVVMVQKEVAQRIVATPPRMNLLAVAVQFYAQPESVYFVSKKSFWPEPKVDSTILKITPTNQFLEISPDSFFQIVKAGFTQPRKQILNNFLKGLQLDKEEVFLWLAINKIDPKRRAETLNMPDWINLLKTFPHSNS